MRKASRFHLTYRRIVQPLARGRWYSKLPMVLSIETSTQANLRLSDQPSIFLR